MQENLQNQEYIKKVQIQKFLKKKEKLQKINPEVELQFTQQFLTKQEIQEHDGYQHILRNIEHKQNNLYFYYNLDQNLFTSQIWNPPMLQIILIQQKNSQKYN
ncbi:hypothetical protein PPERSA_11216 [Pseudocohnilembus persalinus]|uniref:Uncharacterized protein n=1 Tax=Pseudocohnilembus persalinus TaxID=266149 RepID=A0A0V0QZD1_PSEPJ|nr:hypothetical protein PPERSA_11216 [Pseudocohnilembus persalinus]|eukprot:KRX07667.1 hypothetical protein PPERSA_11216 [Pseudocohnilembus persalinus]